jgi:hypothetical protein
MIWPGINSGWGKYGPPGRPYYYTTGNDNKNQDDICEITPNRSTYWRWVAYGYGHCHVGAEGRQENIVRVRLYSAVPPGGDGLGGLAYWCNQYGCS